MFSHLKFLHIEKIYNSQHVLIRLIEEWREYINKDFVIGAVLTDLSKALCLTPSLTVFRTTY